MALPLDLPRSVLSGIVHRVAKKGMDPLSVEGSLRNGGRYNPPGEFGALYTSPDLLTAVEEVARGVRARGVDPAAFGPDDWWSYELEVSIDVVLDLTSAEVLSRLGVSADLLTSGDLATTRRLAQEAREVGYQAVIVPSAAVPGSKNLVIFPDKVSRPPKLLHSRPVVLGSAAGANTFS